MVKKTPGPLDDLPKFKAIFLTLAKHLQQRGGRRHLARSGPVFPKWLFEERQRDIVSLLATEVERLSQGRLTVRLARLTRPAIAPSALMEVAVLTNKPGRLKLLDGSVLKEQRSGDTIHAIFYEDLGFTTDRR